MREQVGFDGSKDDGIFWMDFDDFKDIFGFWSVNKYIDGGKFNYQMMHSMYSNNKQFRDRYKNNEYFLTKITTR